MPETVATSPPPAAAAALQVIAMHGWSGEARHWDPWRDAFAGRGWTWQSGERGYGTATPHCPRWQPEGLRVVIAHSMGPHLLPADLLSGADAVVLLASFGRFVPEGPPGRRLRAALDGMATQLESPEAARAMLRTFLREVAAPDPSDLLPSGPADGPLGASQRLRLREDLERLGRTDGLPEGFPGGIPTLVVEATADRIVVPEARQLLRRALAEQRNPTDCLPLEGAGHGLLRPGLAGQVMAWLETLVSR